jgi:hypothetical protein
MAGDFDPVDMFSQYSGGGFGVFRELDDDAKFTVLEMLPLPFKTQTCAKFDQIYESAICYVFDFAKENLEVRCDDVDDPDDEVGFHTLGQEIINAYNECFPPVVKKKSKKRSRPKKFNQNDNDIELTLKCSSYEHEWNPALSRLKYRILHGVAFKVTNPALYSKDKEPGDYFFIKKKSVSFYGLAEEGELRRERELGERIPHKPKHPLFKSFSKVF